MERWNSAFLADEAEEHLKILYTDSTGTNPNAIAWPTAVEVCMEGEKMPRDNAKKGQ